MLELRVMLWNLGVILWGCGVVNSCLGVWPNSRICVSMAILWSGSSMLPRETRVSFLKSFCLIMACGWFALIPVTVDASFIGQWVKHWKTVRQMLSLCTVVGGFDVDKQLLDVLPLCAAMASLPLCLKPNTRSIHSWRCSDTYWLSRAVLCFWRNSLLSGGVTDRIHEVWSNTQTQRTVHYVVRWMSAQGWSRFNQAKRKGIWHLGLTDYKLPEAHGGRTTSQTKLPFCFLPKSRLSLFSRKLASVP